MLVHPYGTQDTRVSDPRLAPTVADFILAGKETQVVRYPHLMLQESKDGIDYVVHSVLDDYLQDMKDKSIECILSKTERDRYFMKPRILSSDIYGSTELYYIILRINDMWSPKQFTLDNNKLKMLTKDHMRDFLSAIMRIESKDIESYNSLHTD
jgi:hypothetical protein